MGPGTNESSASSESNPDTEMSLTNLGIEGLYENPDNESSSNESSSNESSTRRASTTSTTTARA